jgi:60 kDa SS-A/Ro ribonucleoprotein
LNTAGGGTDCSSAIRGLNEANAKGDAIVMVSDYESWIDGGSYGRCTNGTQTLAEWQKFKNRNKHAKLVCIDLTPRTNSQTTQRPDILNVGGFGDAVFDVVASFIEHGTASDHWVDFIEKTEL